jgi:hypothetical protein
MDGGSGDSTLADVCKESMVSDESLESEKQGCASHGAIEFLLFTKGEWSARN